MPKRKLKSKPTLELHLRVWNPRLGSFILAKANEHRRPLTAQIVMMLEKQMEASADGSK